MFIIKQRIQPSGNDRATGRSLFARSKGKAKCRIAPFFTAVVVLFGATVSGCADIKPWVKPYERDNLADPIMSLSRHGYADAYMHHVYQAREGARGAEGGTGGGCGCN